MIARTNLMKNMSSLQTSLERLSTGFKINSGKDDPAGLIASEMLRSDVTGIKVAIKNTERANMMIATADSALNEVTNLLNDIRGLVTEAANTGAMSREMIYANQLQVDASLDAIDRIAAQTTFMGQKLLDGSLDFNLVGIDRNNLKGLAVNQVTFGANHAPTEVTISVREAAEKAALYYNQPALAEAIVLRWGGNYGFDMETFEKGATVAEIAEIVNKRSDGTGVIADVGSDAIAGLLYVSSLGFDNDMIIRAGLEGLNAGNVEIKYLKGSSEGIQVKYEEPLYAGAPAKILVYLQTEAYNAAFADDIDTTWAYENGKLVPLRDNNALKFEATIEGAQYNGANIYYVDGSLTDPRFYTDLNPTGTPGMPYAYYSDAGQSSSALFGYVPGADPTLGVNSTGLAFELAAGEYFSIQARATGSTYNNVNVQFVAANGSDTVLNGRRAAAVYTEQKDVYGNTVDGGKTLTIYYNNDSHTTLQDVQEALRLERHIGDDGNVVIGTFEIKPQIGTRKLEDVTLFALSSGSTVKSNTHNSGGVPGSLFIVLPPDGKMPARPNIPEMPGVTVKAIGDGLYLAHSSSAWDGYTFEFTQNKSILDDNVSISYDPSTKTVKIVANGLATYDNILDSLNGLWAGKPTGLDDLYWSNASGEPRTPGVPRALTSATGSGVTGRSNLPVAKIDGQDLYLHHDHIDLDDWTVEFVFNNTLPGKYVNVSGDSSAKKIVVTYNANVTYTDILDSLNDPWTGKPGMGTFGWVDADGSPFGGATPPVESGTVVTLGGNALTLSHNDPLWNGYRIDFNNTGTGVLPSVNVSGQVITVTYQDTVATYDDIINALNSNKPIAGMKNLAWGGPAAIGLVGSTIFTSTPTNVTLGTAIPTGTDNFAGSSLRMINTGRMMAKTEGVVSDGFYLAHTNPEWDAFIFSFEKTGTTGGSVTITFDGTNVNIIVDNDATFDTILDALNKPFADPPADTIPAWTLIGGAVIGDLPHVHSPIVGGDGLWWVNSAGSTVAPGVPTSLVSSTASGTYRPQQFSPDGRSTLVGNGLYLQHTHESWDNLNIQFAPTGNPGTGITITFDGTTVSIIADNDVSYDQILFALNTPLGGTFDPGGAAIAIPAWTRPNGSAIPVTQLPKTGGPGGLYDLFWVDANGRTDTVTTPVPASTAIGTTGISFLHSDPKWDGYTFNFSNTGAPDSGVTITASGKILSITYENGVSTYDDILVALNNPWSGKPVGMVNLAWDPASGPTGVVVPPAVHGTSITLGKVTYSTLGLTPNPPLNHVVFSGAIIRDITANDIVALFDLDNPASRGSERAASLFNVSTTVDNDGTGLIRLYDYWIDTSGTLRTDPIPVGIDPKDPKTFAGTDFAYFVKAVTAFEKAFGGGVTGGDVITTAAELVTALNNSAFWGGVMCPEMIAELAKENVLGKYYDANHPPVITASLAPGNHGFYAVSTFEEVAYYGNPDDGTALQFLGGHNSPNIRFVIDGPNSELSIDRTTVPAITGNAQAVLTAQDSGASLTITSALKGGDYDDVQFVFKRVSEDSYGLLAPDRRDGWVEYDPGTSFAYAQATFRNATTNLPVANSAFFVTATERGDLYNNVDIVMRLDDYYTSPDPVTVTFDSKTGQLRISIDSTKSSSVTTNDIIAAINNANVGFKAELSFSEDPLNDGSGKLPDIGLTASRYMSIGNTGDTGGHKGGTVTVWLADANPGPGGPGEAGTYRAPTQEDIVRLINNDSVVGRMFTAKAYNTPQTSDGKVIDFVKDGPIVTSGGLVQPALITVHLATDKAGNVITTAADLAKWWNTLDPALVDNISVSIVRPAGAVWDECADPYGKGLLRPTIERGECDQWIINDIQFVGWNDNTEQQHYVAKYSTGTMTSQRGINSSYQLIAKILGPEWDGYTIEYINDDSVTGRFADNLVSGSEINPCDDPLYSGLLRDDCGNLITPNSTTENGMRLFYDEATKKITIHVKFGVTTANDIQQLIGNDPRTRNRFYVEQLGNGTGLIDPDDNTLLTTGGAKPPGELNGAKLLFGSDATDYYLIFRSREYGSDQFVDVQAIAVDGGNTTFSVSNNAGSIVERAFGKDVDALVNGVRAVGSGLDVSLNTSSLSLNFMFSEYAGTLVGYSTGFSVNGGGATFQVGPDVVSRQQITMGIRSINTVQLGGSTGVLSQLRSGQDADLYTDTNKAFRIVEESLLAITSIRGRLGTMQRATLETNINVLNDTLVALTEAESQIRDTDFAEETSNLTRAQILVQANMNTLGIANQIPNYMLSLIGR